MSAAKKALIVVVVIIALFVIYYFYKKSQNKPLRFLDNGQAGTLVQGKGFSGDLGFVLKKGEAHNLKRGDKVLIVQDTGFKFKEYDGEKTVKAVEYGSGSFSENEIVIVDDYFRGNSPVNSGYMTKVNVF